MAAEVLVVVALRVADGEQVDVRDAHAFEVRSHVVLHAYGHRTFVHVSILLSSRVA